MSDHIVVVGGGLAAGTAVTGLRDNGYDGPVTLFTAEEHPPYERPPLSKDILLGDGTADDTLVKPAEWYAEHDVDLRTGTAVTSLDLAGKSLKAGGEEVGYDKLLLATGARSRPLPMATDAGVPVVYLRTLQECLALKEQLKEGMRIGIVGAGWIGLEVAAAARKNGADVSVFEMAPQPLHGVVGPEVGALFAGVHVAEGVDLRLGATITGFTKARKGVTVELAEGSNVSCDLLLVAVGAEPVVEPAGAAGLRIDDGIRVDEHLRTSDPHVWAAGDVANAQHPVLGRSIRVEHYDVASQHGTVAAANLAGGNETHAALPYFFTDQYDLGMEYVGHPGPDGWDRVVLRGTTAGGSGDLAFTAWWLRGKQVVAGMQVNDWDATDEIRRIVGSEVDAERLGNESVELADLG